MNKITAKNDRRDILSGYLKAMRIEVAAALTQLSYGPNPEAEVEIKSLIEEGPRYGFTPARLGVPAGLVRKLTKPITRRRQR